MSHAWGSAVSEARAYSTITSWFRWILEYFLPDSLTNDREATNQARMFLVSHTVGPILGGTVPLSLFLFDPTPHSDVFVLALSIFSFWLFPFLLRAGIAYHHLVILSVINLNFAILWSCYHYGGVASPTLTWVLIIPILSLFYVGGEKRYQPHLLAVTGVSFSLFFLLYLFVPPPENDMPQVAMVGLGAVSTVATLAYVATMAVYYARIFDAGVDLEHEVERRRHMSDELRKAVIAADRASSAKAEFLARMSHELRTPLNAIIGYGQILREDAIDTDDELLKQDIDRILDAGHYLLRLINTILDLSKIEAGRMRFNFQAHYLRPLLDGAVEAHRSEIDEQRIEVEVDVEPGLETIEVDDTRLMQVLDSIIENAVRHTPAGKIRLEAQQGIAGGHRVFSVKVTDTGCGIEPDVLPTLFKTFATTRHAANGRYGGTGLKLAVCSKLCQAMGGEVHAESVLGEGSTFTVTLPKQPLSGRAPDAVDQEWTGQRSAESVIA